MFEILILLKFLKDDQKNVYENLVKNKKNENNNYLFINIIIFNVNLGLY